MNPPFPQGSSTRQLNKRLLPSRASNLRDEAVENPMLIIHQGVLEIISPGSSGLIHGLIFLPELFTCSLEVLFTSLIGAYGRYNTCSNVGFIEVIFQFPTRFS